MTAFSDWLAPHYVGWLLQGFALTLWLSALVSVAATILGFFVCLGRLSRHPVLSFLARTYLSLFRNTPLLIQLFFWYFGASGLMPEAWVSWLNTPHQLTLGGLTLSWPSFEFLAALWGLSLYAAAFIAEELRSGVQGVRSSQWAAARSLGLTDFQIWRWIIMPQALRNAFPSLLGQYMNTIKNTSLTMAIGLAELSYASRQVETESLKAFQAFGIATALYVLAVALVEIGGQYLQQRRYQVWGGQR
ncbi:MAG TPA: amino acid ABC transporter permease [Alcaligenes sp.]|nr:amino acid ABC transporter permease [Alcaligenes sp.]HRL26964.1 amino acid ABC transporter permease [Alcaligenes sp.]